MATVREIKNRLSGFNAALREILEKSILENADKFIELNQQQMLHGLASDGEEIGVYRNPLYAEYKQARNPLPNWGVPDLRDTGAFYKGMEIKKWGDDLYIISTDEKTEELTAKYGDVIFGLTEESLKKISDEVIQPTIVEKIRQLLKL